MSAFRLLVFDWDGTLIDSEARIVACLEGAIADAGVPVRPRERLREIIGLGLNEAVRALYPEADADLAARLAEGYRRHFLGDGLPPSVLFAGVRETLAGLREAGFTLAIATGKGRRGLDHALATTALGEFFAASRCADEAPSKPQPAMLCELMDETGFGPEATLMIGDTEYDLRMAQNAGVASVAVASGVHGRARLLECAPLVCLETVAQLPEWLGLGSH